MHYRVFAVFTGLLISTLGQAQTYAIFSFDPPAGATYMTVTGINNAGQILVAWTDASQAKHSSLRSANGASYSPVEVPGATGTWATGLNNPGQIVGLYDSPSGTHSFIRSADGQTFTSFDAPGGGAAAYGTPSGINDKGEIIGAGYSAAPISYGFLRSADGSTYTTILVTRATGTFVTGINNSGEISGWSTFGGSTGVRHGFVRKADGTVNIVDVPGTLSGTHLAAINNHEQLLASEPHGFAINPDGSTAGFDPSLAGTPSAMDDNGRVAGTNYSGGIYRGFLAIPTGSGTQPAIRSVMGAESASGFGGFSTLAPGSWIEIYGANLAPGTRQWRASDFNGNTAPTSLDGVKVTINGRPAFVSYISPGQVNAQAPSTLTPGPAQVTITNGTQTSTGYSTTIAANQPGLLSMPAGEGIDYLLAVFPDYITYVLPRGVVESLPSRPAKAGETIVIYGIGFGATSPNVPAGQIATGPNSLPGVEVSFNNVPVQVTYAGHAPGSVGLYQFNLVVPDGIAQPFVPYTLATVSFRVNGVAIAQNLEVPVAQ